jgi:DTW domain-containing protein
MNLASFLEKRKNFEESLPKTRGSCFTCFQPEICCYCASVKPFDAKIEFVILIHPIEVRRRIATGRMSHLCLEGSKLIRGENYSDRPEVNRLVNDPLRHCVILYPGTNSANLSQLNSEERADLFPNDKTLTIFVIDGTWNTARKMVRSTNLQRLPRICFSPSTPSRFRVRKQPQEGCYSTIEAIHQTIELVGEGRGFATAERRHDSLLEVFDVMVERQLAYIRELGASRHINRHAERPL